VKPPSIEEAFRMGAEAMKSEIAVRLMAKGGAATVIAPLVLSMPLPKFKVPESFVVEGGKQ